MSIRYLSGINVDSNTLFVDDVNNRVGIGTGSPAYTLDVNGSLHSTNITIADAIYHEGDTNNYISFGTDIQAFTTSGSERMRINAVGDVGIGTNAPTATGNYRTLEVKSANASAGGMFILATSDNAGVMRMYSTSTVLYIDDSSSTSDLYFKTNGANYVALGTNNAERLRVTSAGNVGIGTTSPVASLQVGSVTTSVYGLAVGKADIIDANKDISDTQMGTLNVTSTSRSAVSPFNQGFGPSITFTQNGSGYVNGYERVIGGIKTEIKNAVNLNFASIMQFYTHNNTELSPRMTIDGSNGNVGIGTSAPGAKLDVVGEIFASSNVQISATGAAGKYYIRRPSDGSASAFFGYNSADNTDFGVYNGSGGGNVKFWSNNGIFQFNNIASSELMRITSAGNVGIGTTSPGYSLDVAGTSRSDLHIFRSNQSAPTADAFIFRPADNTVALGTANAERMRVTSVGNVGIGTTSPGNKLHVDAGASNTHARFSGQFTGIQGITVERTGAAPGSVRLVSNFTSFGGGLESSGPLRFAVNGNDISSPSVIINTAGNVGIGTTAPAAKLHVAGGEIRVDAGQAITLDTSNNMYLVGASNQLRLYNGSNPVVNITTAGNVGIGTTSPSVKLHVAGSTFIDSGFLYMSSGLPIVWGSAESIEGSTGVINIKTASTSRIYINSTGDVGVGTTAPTNRLTVTTATNAVDVVRLNNTGGDSGSVQGVTHLAINHFNSGTNPSTRITAYQDGVSGWPGGMYFSTRSLNTDSAPVERMRITSAGNVGIGTSSPNASYRTTITTGAGQTGALQTTGSVNINSGALAVGSITPSGTAGRIDASNDIVAFSTSDRRFKENITPIANALDKVKTLTGVEFDWKMETKDYHGYVGHDVGVIAQDVQAVLPEAVRTNHNGYLSVRYEKMIALLVEANKELAARVEELEKKLK